MQDYIEFARKNKVELKDEGPCQFCGALTNRGIHECLEIFNLSFGELDLTSPDSHKYRFFIVDAHALQHPEIHGRWSNHFNLTRLHLIFKYQVQWRYELSSVLSNQLNTYKSTRQGEVLIPPAIGQRGLLNSTTVMKELKKDSNATDFIVNWAKEVYMTWHPYHSTLDQVAQIFIVE